MLQRRVNQIDAIINDHLMKAFGHMKFKMELERLDQNAKLEMLLGQQEVLQAGAAKKGDKSDSSGDNDGRCRFEALI